MGVFVLKGRDEFASRLMGGFYPDTGVSDCISVLSAALGNIVNLLWSTWAILMFLSSTH